MTKITTSKATRPKRTRKADTQAARTSGRNPISPTQNPKKWGGSVAVAGMLKHASHAKNAARPIKTTKLATIIALLQRSEGTSLAELMAATSWQAHSIRGVLAGTLRQRGFAVESTKTDGIRRYRIIAAAPEPTR